MTRTTAYAAALGLLLAGCTNPTQQAVLTTAGVTLATLAAQNNTTAAALVAKGQTICGVASSVPGQLATMGLVALANVAGVPVAVTGALATTVADACQAIGKVPGPLPAAVDPATVPVVTVATTLPKVPA